MADWDPNNPGDSDFISQYPPNERAARSAVRTNFGVDHHETDDADVGKHEQATMLDKGGDPTAASGQGVFYAKTVSGQVEAFYMDASGNAIQLTSGGNLLYDLVTATDTNISAPAGGHGLFYNNGKWENRTPAQVRAHLDLDSIYGRKGASNTWTALNTHQAAVRLENTGDTAQWEFETLSDGRVRLREQTAGINRILVGKSGSKSDLSGTWDISSLRVNSGGTVTSIKHGSTSYSSRTVFAFDVELITVSVPGLSNGDTVAHSFDDTLGNTALVLQSIRINASNSDVEIRIKNTSDTSVTLASNTVHVTVFSK